MSSGVGTREEEHTSFSFLPFSGEERAFDYRASKIFSSPLSENINGEAPLLRKIIFTFLTNHSRPPVEERHGKEGVFSPLPRAGKFFEALILRGEQV